MSRRDELSRRANRLGGFELDKTHAANEIRDAKRLDTNGNAVSE